MAVIFTISIYRKSGTLIGIIILITCHNLWCIPNITDILRQFDNY